MTLYARRVSSKRKKDIDQVLEDSALTVPSTARFIVVFVLGGPGTGKGTQCQLVVDRLLQGKKKSTTKWHHLSAGDLLRAERKRNSSPLGDLINQRIAAGQLVPSAVTCQLIVNAMVEIHQKSQSQNKGHTYIVLDGFPRSFDNWTAWQNSAVFAQAKLPVVLCFDCPEDVQMGRLIERSASSGRIDDTKSVIQRRFQTYRDSEAPMVDYFIKETNLLKRIAADQPKEAVFKAVKAVLEGL